MNYWPAEVTNLAECHEPLFDTFEEIAAGRRGHRPRALQRPRLGAAPQLRPVARHRPDQPRQPRHLADRRRLAGQHLWEHYLYGGDRPSCARPPTR
jgi:alpha-L-fucosidase 2